MPWTRKQVRFLLSKGTPLTDEQKSKMLAELHADPSLGHKQPNAFTMKRKKKAR